MTWERSGVGGNEMGVDLLCLFEVVGERVMIEVGDEGGKVELWWFLVHLGCCCILFKEWGN